ncbi:MAG TPA: O-antigen ligase family protein [Anaerolineaceae bacterium]|nr:O-antigen ligase family protein [Anaerolineaceae bacterium]
MKKLVQGSLVNPIILLTGTAGYFLLFTEGGFRWNGNLWVKAASLVYCTLLIGLVLYYQGIRKKASFPKTGLELGLGLAVLVIILTWITSPDLRQSLERSVQLLFYIILFYIFFFLLITLKNRILWIVIGLAACSVLLVSALAETVTAYSRWYEWVSPEVISPPFLYRFNGLLGNSNALMALVNLFMPVCLVQVFSTKKSGIKALYATWLALYSICLVFSSSRGGVLGIIVSLIILLAFTILHHGWQKDMSAWYSQKPRLAIATLIFFVAVIATIGIASSSTFLQHPSHGSGFWDSRLPVWQAAVTIWQSSPVVGIGPGRFAFVYLDQATSIPPLEWSTSTHQTLLTVLVESGLLGFTVLIILGFFLVRSVIRLYLKLDISSRMTVAGGIAGLAGFAAHSMVDDFIAWPVVMVPVVFMLAWVFAALPKNQQPQLDASLNILFVPAGVIFTCSLLVIVAYAPFWTGLQHVKAGQVDEGSRRMAQSIELDPNLTYYRVETGFVRAFFDENLENKQLLSLAKSDLSQALKSKPELHWVSANLGVLEWQNGNSEAAKLYLHTALKAAPQEPSYPLNLGVIYEDLGQFEQAAQMYGTSLTLAPQTSSHPFWQMTFLREKALHIWQVENLTPGASESTPYWQLAISSLATDLHRASKYAALSRWTNELPLGSLIAEWKVLNALGDDAGELEVLEELFQEMRQPVLSTGRAYSETYSQIIHQRAGLKIDMVPGYLLTSQDVGQFKALERLADLYQLKGDCVKSKQVWEILQRSKAGYSIITIPDTPICNPE